MKSAYPLLQCGGRPQKNQMGVVGSETSNENTPTWRVAASKGMKPELNPVLFVAVLNCPKVVTVMVRLVIRVGNCGEKSTDMSTGWRSCFE